MGLKLSPQKGQIDIVAVDHVEKPTENYVAYALVRAA